MSPNSTDTTLTIDIGGQGIKAMAISGRGEPCSPRHRIKTPRPATPKAVTHAIETILKRVEPYDRVSVGFPGVVVDGVVATAPNLDGRWKGVQFQDQLAKIAGTPLKVLNDADMQGYGAIDGQGVEMVLTLGTGVGSALFVHGILMPNLEFGHHPFEKDSTYEERLGQAALDRHGDKVWNERISRAIKLLRRIFNFRHLYLGGGNSRCVKIKHSDDVVLVKNSTAFFGGARLWAPRDPSPAVTPAHA